MAWENVLLETVEAVAVVTVNRPKVLNALNLATLKELAEVFDRIAGDASIQAVILTGSGDKAFVAGADISYMQNLTPLQAREFALLGQRVFNQIENLPQPVIAAVNGYALGGGCELAMACDIRIASNNAKFGQPEVGLGIIPGFAGTQRLSRLVGKGIAKEILYSGEHLSAERAWQIGLVNHVVTPEELQNRAMAMAKRIMSNGPVAVRLTKEAVNNGMEMDAERAMFYEADLFGLCFSTNDQKEGMAAFLSKRKPQFSGT